MKIPYIEVHLDDIAVANKLMAETLGRSLDELTPQTRRFLELLSRMVKEHCDRERIDRSAYHFMRKEVRDNTGWSDFQVRTHINKLVFLEYVIVHRGRRGQSFVYELIYNDEGQSCNRFMMCLIDVESLQKQELDGKNEHPKTGFEHGNGKFKPSSSIQSGPIEHPSSIDECSVTGLNQTCSENLRQNDAKNAYKGYQKSNHPTIKPTPKVENF